MTMLLGCDFTSSPSRRKPLVLAWGQAEAKGVRLLRVQRCFTFEAMVQALATSEPWVGGFDLPFGLPRELVLTLGWPTEWWACMQHYTQLSREDIRHTFARFCQSRPPGGKWAHRATDGPAGASPSMKWVNPPVAFMMHAGLPLLWQLNAHFPGLHDGNRQRVALEAYPGMWAREVLQRQSYKSDTAAKQTPERAEARGRLLAALVQGHARWPLRLKVVDPLAEALVQDATGDTLDAVLCMMQAAWAQQRFLEGDPLYGLPPGMDPLEGWIIHA